MNRVIFSVLLVIFLLNSFSCATTQGASSTPSATITTSETEEKELPQWVKDMRRWDIIAFGSFPFAVFTSAVVTDIRRWYENSNFDFSEEGRAYAPWPLKSSQAVERTNEEIETMLITAAIISATLAFTDLAIVYLKRNKERRRAEALPKGTVIINRMPYGEEEIIIDTPPELNESQQDDSTDMSILPDEDSQ